MFEERLAKRKRAAKAAAAVSCAAILAVAGVFAYMLAGTCAQWAENVGLVPRNNGYYQVLAVTELCCLLAFALVAFVFGWSAKEGSPFAGPQSMCLGLAGVLLITKELIGYYGFQALLNSSKPPTMTIVPSFDVTVLGLGVFLICLAAVFRYGGLIEEDSNGTV